MLFSNKLSQQLWHFSSSQLIKILIQILDQNSADTRRLSMNNLNTYSSNERKISFELDKKEVVKDVVKDNSIDENKGEVKEDTKIDEVNNVSEVSELDVNKSEIVSEKVKDNILNDIQIWDSIISCLEAIFKQTEGKNYKNIDKNIVDELIRSCQEMEIQIINFIVNNLLPNSFKIPKNLQNKLLTLLDQGSVFDFHNTSTGSVGNQSKPTQVPDFTSISRVFISNLFELCKYKPEDTLTTSKIRVIR